MRAHRGEAPRLRRVKIEMTDKTLRVRRRGGYLAAPVKQ